jgi:4-hydroxybenzoate polyprenyltransferase
MRSELMQPVRARSPARRSDTRPTLPRLLSCIRFDEVLVLQGTPLLGALFSIGKFTAQSVVDLFGLAIASCLLVAHVFVLNDWSGMSADLQDPNRASSVFVRKGIRRAEVGYLWISLLAFGLVLFAMLGAQPLIIAVSISIASALYSAPLSHAKGIPLLSSFLHLIGGTLHFLLGYSVFHPMDARGLLIGCFFGLTFMAGHLTHEARDREGDIVNGIRTNAVTFGAFGSFIASLVLFTSADVLLVALAYRGIVPRVLVVVAALYPFHLYWSLRVLSRGLSFESIRGLQLRYRALYAVLGLTMALAVLLSH